MLAADKDIILLEPYHIKEKLLSFNKKFPLPGIALPERLDCLVNQTMDSIIRINRITEIRNTVHSRSCIEPANEDFNPLVAASYNLQNGNIDEAFWLIFLATHFGEEEISKKWNHVRNVYHALGNVPYWTWEKTSADPNGFRLWLQSNKEVLQQNGRFGNHRKYESLLDEHTGKTIASYIDCIGENRRHEDLFNYMRSQVGTHPHILFDAMYKKIEVVWRFGRTSKFDYLSMAGKLGLANIKPGHPYLQDATGPLDGARLLFGNRTANTQTMNLRLRELGLHLNLYYGMQIIEDAVCNWQKSPDTFISFLT